LLSRFHLPFKLRTHLSDPPLIVGLFHQPDGLGRLLACARGLRALAECLCSQSIWARESVLVNVSLPVWRLACSSSPGRLPVLTVARACSRGEGRPVFRKRGQGAAGARNLKRPSTTPGCHSPMISSQHLRSPCPHSLESFSRRVFSQEPSPAGRGSEP